MSKVKVLFVCLGNICRSPLAEGIFRQRVEERGLSDRYEIDSCGTAAYHIGKQPDSRSMANAKKNGVLYNHSARQFEVDDFHNFDVILPMDDSNYEDVISLKPRDSRARVVKMRDYDNLGNGSDVPDPYYGGEKGFQEVFDILDRSVNSLIDSLELRIKN
ncbi:low molecular weight protein-tyrosine-phosphatase [Roseivirga sp. E12]|uniref:low molecular weight protein-tyrosine-phosphatase n=1 Tax=Roseivirga sp. E12 TaxID=2819237 RepID=UPI001ABCCD20|nr:low molecular weight protein-tyrosine-phosphatase [Roseivirga sp. E12]MBO3698286.1 low molecular weight phosphotyrosine protein phosphatase [Roseivirga sp. E12]